MKVEKLKLQDYFYNKDMNCYYKLPIENGKRKMALKMFTDYIIKKNGSWINEKNR